MPYLIQRSGLGDLSPALASAAAGGIVGGIEFGLSQWINSARLRGGQKIGATEIEQWIQAAMQTNFDNYMSSRPHTKSEQAAALAQFDGLMLALMGPQGCGNMEFGSAGQRCITERVRGGIYSLPAALRDPIAQDTTVADAVVVAGTTGAAASGANQGLTIAQPSGIASLAASPLFLLAAVAGLALVVLK